MGRVLGIGYWVLGMRSSPRQMSRVLRLFELFSHGSGFRSSKTAPSEARLRLAVRSCAPLRSARWFPSDWPRCTRARRIGRGHRAACDCATRDAASHTTSRLGASARTPLRTLVDSRHPGCDVDDGHTTKRCALPRAPGALPLPVHRNAARSPPGSRNSQDPGLPSPRPTAGQRAGRGCGYSPNQRSCSESGSGFRLRLRLPRWSLSPFPCESTHPRPARRH